MELTTVMYSVTDDNYYDRKTGNNDCRIKSKFSAVHFAPTFLSSRATRTANT